MAGYLMASEVPDAALQGIGAFAAAVFIAMASWALMQLVSLARIIARLDERTNDHDRRLDQIEAAQREAHNIHGY